MLALRGFTLLLLCQCVGELAARGLHWPLPGPVLGPLAPKGATAPVAMGVADALGGVAALAAVFAVLTGLIGAISGRGAAGPPGRRRLCRPGPGAAGVAGVAAAARAL